VIAWGGTISAEHGVGKLKVELLRKMYGSDSIDGMRRLIECFNPGRRLNRGNMVP
jgi:D-lactate dehydrogenase (cytochrome)